MLVMWVELIIAGVFSATNFYSSFSTVPKIGIMIEKSLYVFSIFIFKKITNLNVDEIPKVLVLKHIVKILCIVYDHFST